MLQLIEVQKCDRHHHNVRAGAPLLPKHWWHIHAIRAFPSNARMSAMSNPKHDSADNNFGDLCHSEELSAPLWIVGLFLFFQSPANSSGPSRFKLQPMELAVSWRPLSYSHASKKRNTSPPSGPRKNVSVLMCEAGEPTVAKDYMGRSGILWSRKAMSYMVATDFADPKLSAARSVSAFQGREKEHLIKSLLLLPKENSSPLADVKNVIEKLVMMSTKKEQNNGSCYSVDQLLQQLESAVADWLQGNHSEDEILGGNLMELLKRPSFVHPLEEVRCLLRVCAHLLCDFHKN